VPFSPQQNSPSSGSLNPARISNNLEMVTSPTTVGNSGQAGSYQIQSVGALVSSALPSALEMLSCTGALRVLEQHSFFIVAKFQKNCTFDSCSICLGQYPSRSMNQNHMVHSLVCSSPSTKATYWTLRLRGFLTAALVPPQVPSGTAHCALRTLLHIRTRYLPCSVPSCTHGHAHQDYAPHRLTLSDQASSGFDWLLTAALETSSSTQPLRGLLQHNFKGFVHQPIKCKTDRPQRDRALKA
jgi:hypothetical protein